MELFPASFACPRFDRLERFPSVDVNHLSRIGAIAPGPVDEDEFPGWARVSDRGEPVTVTMDQQAGVARVWCVDGSGSFRIEWSACRFGGQRPWALCPECTSRRVRLYLAAGRWACRTCLGLKYESQRLRPDDRALLKAERARQRLGQREPAALGSPPPLPRKYARTRKYFCLVRQLQQAEMEALDHVHADIGRML